MSLKGHRWFVSFIDDCSRTTWLYMMKEKNEVFSIFQNFHKMVCTQFGAVVKILRFDNGGEYIDSKLGPRGFVFLPMGFFIKPLALTLLNRTEWPNTRIVIC